jgi:hypothetical protein
MEYGLDGMRTTVMDNIFKHFGKVVGNRTKCAIAQTVFP